MKVASVKTKNLGGRPRISDDPVMRVLPVRLPSRLADQVDAWGQAQMPRLDRSKAVRALIEKGLAS